MEHMDAEFRRQSRRLFAVLRAIIRRSTDSASTKGEYAARLEGRIGALARVHDMILRAPQDGVDLEEIVQAELLAQAIPVARCRVGGPDTRIRGEAPLPLALALHELVVNAVVHGAFLGAHGTLEVTWSYVERDGRDWLRLVWEECDTSALRNAPGVKGFGMELIESMLPYELDAGTRVSWLDPGARVEIEIPTDHRAVSWSPGERLAM
jgi:two-component system, chemotaxis family, CheB/CheR fusion protein